jgi:hypothetical protein
MNHFAVTSCIALATIAAFAVAFIASAVLVVAGAGIYAETTRTTENSEPFANEFAIADSAIQSEFSP